jgi:hypothetical protein
MISSTFPSTLSICQHIRPPPSTPWPPPPPPPPQANADPARSTAVYESLKDDPELSHVFDDVKNNGPGALQK